MVKRLEESANPSNSDFQPASRQIQVHGILTQGLDNQNDHVNDRTFGELAQDSQYELTDGHQYECVDQLHENHQYEYPFLGDKKADTTRTAVCAKDNGYSPLARPSLNENETENGGYTSLIKDEKASEKGGTTAKNGTDGLSYVDIIYSHYTPC